MLKNFAEAQNNINTTFDKPLNIIGKISSIIGIILSILVVSDILFSISGTFKSSLSKIFLF